MTPRSSGVSPWISLLFIALLGNAQAQSKPGNVTNLSATVTTSSISVTWTKPDESVSSYNVSWGEGFSTTNETSKNIMSLTPGTLYTVTVTAIANGVEGGGVTLQLYTEPEVVSNLTVTEITTSSVSLNWTKPEGKSPFYRVRWTDEITNMSATVTETSLNVTGLTSGERYNFTVQSVAGDNETESRERELFIYAKPDAVSNLTVTEITTSSVSLNWTKPEGKSPFYRVRWTDEITNRSATVTETSMNVTGLTPGERYHFTVQSVAGDNETESKERELFRYTKPEAVRNLTVFEITTSSVSLNWTKPEGKSPFYRVRWTDEITNRCTTVTETSLNVTGLTPGERYHFTVQSVAGDNETESRERELFIYTKPDAVSNLTVTEITTSSVSLNWTKPEGKSPFYRVRWTDEITNRSATVTETSMNVTGLTPGERYHFTVQSVAGDNETESRERELFRYTKPEAVSDLTVTEITTSSVSVNWTKPEGKSPFYRVRWTDEITNRSATVTETSMNVTGLTPGERYHFTVQSVAGDNETESRERELFRYTKPEAVIKLAITEITTSSVHLNWIKPEGKSPFYRVRWTDEVNRSATVNETSMMVTGLTPGVRYNFTVQSVAGDNETESKMTPVDHYTKPGQVGNLAVLSSNTSSISVRWTKPPGEVFLYKVQWEKDKIETISMERTSAVLTDLVSGTEYTINVTAVAGDNTSEGLHTSVTAFTYPEAVSSISIINVTTSSVSLEWMKPKGGVSEFIVHWQNESFRGNRSVIDTSITISGLTPGVQHNFSVTTVAGDKETPGETRTQHTRPDQPINIRVTHRGTDYLNISWTLADGRADSYSVTTQNSDLMHLFVNKTDVPSFSIRNLYPGRIFNVSVTSVAGNVSHVSDQVSFATSPTPPGAISITWRTNSSLHLMWDTPEMMEDAPDISYKIAYQEGGEEQLQTTTNSTCVLPLLSSGTSYSITVKTVGPQNLSSTAVQTSSFTLPNPVLNLTARPNSTTAMTVEWSEPWGAKPYYKYSVDVINETGHSVFSENVTGISKNVPNLVPGSEYHVNVTTIAAPGSQSDTKHTSNYTIPESVPDLMVAGSTTNLGVSWGKPSGRVSSYSALLYRDDRWVENKTGLSNATFDTEFVGLKPGVEYCVVLVTESGPYQNKSRVCNATYPNPPGPITVLSQTVKSINVTWTFPEDMTPGRCNFSVSTTNGSVLTGNNWYLLDNVQSGSPFNISVVTVGVNQYRSPEVRAEYYTRPYGITQLEAETLNTTDIRLSWEKPLEYKSYYKYWVTVSGCALQNRTAPPTTPQTVVVSELLPGTLCTFCVSVEAGVTRGEESCVSQYTKPGEAQPSVSSRGSNSSILVWWTKPEGNVEKYQVFLNSSSSGSNEPVQRSSIQLDSSRTDYWFDGLPAGRLYSAMIVTISGPFNTTSALRDNATYPNPPGPIEILTRTTTSLEITWGEPPLMAGVHVLYKLTNTPFLSGGNITTVTPRDTNYTFFGLASGTSFNFSVLTVGVLDLESEEVVRHIVTTRPLSVTFLGMTADETTVTLNWTKPADYKSGYRYNLTWQISNEANSETVSLNDTQRTIDTLIPGSSYDFSVTTETSDGTQAEPNRTSVCTRASPVKNIRCVGPNQTDAEIILFWDEPEGQNSGFYITVGHEEPVQNSRTCCNFTVANLQHYQNYTISVATQSCGQPSSPETKTCRSGITNPPLPPDYEKKVESKAETHNKFSVSIASSLIDNKNGRITHVGVLVRRKGSGSTSGGSDFHEYLDKTYDQWKAGDTDAYLATVTRADEPQSRSNQLSSMDIGDGATWKGYANGALDPDTEYQFAIVLFTQLTLNKALVDVKSSLVSGTEFIFSVKLPVDPVVIGIAVGATLGVFLILLTILVGFIIYWKRVSVKESPDIQIQSLRAKVSVPVRVEEYEAYFRKQKADSNCGFAEEFEDLKPVGVGQSNIHALSLENKPKNRYSNVLPYDSSRVKLSIIHGNPNDDYINANYVPGFNSRKEFIAAQGPLPATVNAFWRMIWEKNVQTLVMLTRCNEQGRVKCEQYWSLGTKHYGNITVTTNSEIPLEDWTIRDFTIKNVKTAETRSVRHFHFTAWPDHGVPETTELLFTFRHLVREHMNQFSRNSPTVVHCSAGVGRTGTLISIDRLMFQIERENIVDVYGIVHDLRMHRSLMVQTEDQYVFLNQCALDIIRSRTGTNVDLIYQNASALSIYENVEPKKGFSKNRH